MGQGSPCSVVKAINILCKFAQERNQNVVLLVVYLTFVLLYPKVVACVIEVFRTPFTYVIHTYMDGP